MIAFLILAFITKDVVYRHLFASSGIITGAFISKFANQNQIKNEKY
jgi:hypothetical protein